MFGGVEAKVIRKYFKAPFECNPWAVILSNLSASAISEMTHARISSRAVDITSAPGTVVSMRR